MIRRHAEACRRFFLNRACPIVGQSNLGSIAVFVGEEAATVNFASSTAELVTGRKPPTYLMLNLLMYSCNHLK
jgi:hypothetical protein